MKNKFRIRVQHASISQKRTSNDSILMCGTFSMSYNVIHGCFTMFWLGMVLIARNKTMGCIEQHDALMSWASHCFVPKYRTLKLGVDWDMPQMKLGGVKRSKNHYGGFSGHTCARDHATPHTISKFQNSTSCMYTSQLWRNGRKIFVLKWIRGLP